jgi:putative oligomerization/nucleic acid binding protein
MGARLAAHTLLSFRLYERNNMTLTPAEEAKSALDHGSSRSSLSPEAQVIYDRLAVERRAGEIRSILETRIATLERGGVSGRDPATAAEIAILGADCDKLGAAVAQITAGRQPDRLLTLSETAVRVLEQPPGYEEMSLQEWGKLLARSTPFPNLGVAVHDGNVYGTGGRLGPLTGAHAEVLAGKTGTRRRSGHARVADTVIAASVLGPVGLLAAISRAGTGVAVVVFADGSVRQKEFTDKPSLLRAQAEAVRFNALAASAQPGAAPAPAKGSAQNPTGVAAELERLAALHASGALDADEFRAAKARVLGTST